MATEWPEGAGILADAHRQERRAGLGATPVTVRVGYSLTLTGQERRAFGPIEIERSAQTGAPFSVLR